MAAVQCKKCGQSRDGMAAPPFRAGTKLEDLGREIHANVCAGCYKDWIAMSVKLVNEMRMETSDPRAQQLWLSQMRLFLALDGGADDPWSRFLDKRVKVETTHGVSVTATLVGSTPERLNFAEFDGGQIPEGFDVGNSHTPGSASIARDAVRALEPV